MIDEIVGRDKLDLVVTSPPYNLDKPYPGYDDDRAYREYLGWVRTWAISLLLATAPGGRLCLNVALDTNKGGYRPLYVDYTRTFQEIGWKYRNAIVWNEQNISRRTAWGSYAGASGPSVMAPVEMIAVFYKDRWIRELRPLGVDGIRAKHARQSGIDPEDFKAWVLGMWTFPGESPKKVGGHPAPFPEELARRCILLYSFYNDLVCDPFMGSGTTPRVALDLGRNAIGVDIDPAYFPHAVRRCGLSLPDGGTYAYGTRLRQSA